MTHLLSVCGKGGVGKSTFLTLTLKALLSKGYDDILVIDGDPDSNMPDLLGVKPQKTVGQVMDNLVSKIEFAQISPTADKNRLIEAEIFNVTTETSLFDLFVMGSLESDGCYCPLTHNLSRVLGRNIQQYQDFALLDLPAGLEPINRGLIKEVQTLFIVMDGSRLSISTMKRILQLIQAFQHQPTKIVAVGCKLDQEISNLIEKAVTDLNVVYGGWLPYDQEIVKLNMSEGSLLNIKDESPAFKATEQIIDTFVV